MSGGFSIDFQDRDRYLYAFVTGERDSLQVSLAYWTAVAAECRARGKTRVLVIETFKEKGPLVDVYHVAAELPRITRGIRVAFVDRDLGDAEENMFAETVAVNRGANGRLFGDEAAAIAWLESD